MENLGIERVRAIHPHWNSFLQLSRQHQSVTHEGDGNRGKYKITDGVLTVYWERFPKESFVNVDGIYIHEKIAGDFPELEQLARATVGRRPVTVTKVNVKVPDNDYEVTLRLQTSDVHTFNQIFIRSEYASPNLPNCVNTIVDLGSNIGLATVFFGIKYPLAKILSVEPEVSNHELMVQNTMPLGPRIQKEHAAVWINDGTINIHTEDEVGQPLGAWGVQVSDKLTRSATTTSCYKLGSLLDKAGFERADILKIDIEGAELDVFSHNVDEWLPRVDLIIIETHDRIRAGSEAAVRSAILPLFEELPPSGENLFFRRI